MSTPDPQQGKSKRKRQDFWSRLEDARDGVEFGLRAMLGILFGCVFAGAAWGAGSHIWSGVGFIAALSVFPLGFLIGFFWVEVKLLLSMAFGFVVGILRLLF